MGQRDDYDIDHDLGHNYDKGFDIDTENSHDGDECRLCLGKCRLCNVSYQGGWVVLAEHKEWLGRAIQFKFLPWRSSFSRLGTHI